MPAKTLMIQGTSSSVGKSLLVAALCRIFSRRGVQVAPFKAQNMSNNAAVCADGAEIGRAQAVQAAAAGLEPHADMNPILLKPEAEARSQVVVLGRPWQTLPAGGYYRRKDELWPVVTAALDRLRADYQLVVIEGAGSPVELNLRATDIVNMEVALYARAPVVLAGDIDRGGIFAQLLGTLELFSSTERALVRGLIVNKFRGDRALFGDGVRILEERSGLPILGVIPYLQGLHLPEEDSVALDAPAARLPSGAIDPGCGTVSRPCHLDAPAARPPSGAIDVAIVRLPHIANFDDFDPLQEEPNVHVRFVESASSLGAPCAVILPGTKSTLADLDWLRAQRLDESIHRLANEGTPVAGICGGYQMLGEVIHDPNHVESSVSELPGLGLLPVETNFENAKAAHQVKAKIRQAPGWLVPLQGKEVAGYEIHCGRSQGGKPWLDIARSNGDCFPDGAVSDDGRVWGCYLHGLFANANLRRAWLDSLGSRQSAVGSRQSAVGSQQSGLERLADAVENALDMKRMTTIIEEGVP